ncbi:MAG: Arm DNA-binding domain-containing protein [Alphaproteobacteria bacterium]|nr:Arm DNA-binding domain-containing protein [Alphaproteobacteria bacterium]
MPGQATRLAAAKVSKAGPGRYGDGGGLYLLVRPNGTRFWLFRYTRAGRQRELGLGPAGTDQGRVSLEAARKKADALMRQVRAGIDPLAARQAEELAAKAEAEAAAIKAITFEAAAKRYIDVREAGWRNPKHCAQWRATLETYAYPHESPHFNSA